METECYVLERVTPYGCKLYYNSEKNDDVVDINRATKYTLYSGVSMYRILSYWGKSYRVRKI